MKFKKTAKKLLSGLLILVCTIRVCIKTKGINTTTYCNETADATKTKRVTVTHNLSSRIKIGEDLGADILEGKYYIQFNNLNPNKEVFFSTGDYGYNLNNGYNINNFNFATKKYFFTRHCGSCDSFKVSKDGICKDIYSLYYLQTAYKPGEVTFQPEYCYKFSDSCLQIPK